MKASRSQICFRGGLGAELITVEASDEFLGALKGVTDPETKAQDRRREIHPHF
jgi:GMP synthase PP-ATPase subunit